MSDQHEITQRLLWLLHAFGRITERLLTDRRWHVHLLFPWIADGVRQRLPKPLANSFELQIHGGLQASLISLIKRN